MLARDGDAQKSLNVRPIVEGPIAIVARAHGLRGSLSSIGDVFEAIEARSQPGASAGSFGPSSRLSCTLVLRPPGLAGGTGRPPPTHAHSLGNLHNTAQNLHKTAQNLHNTAQRLHKTAQTLHKTAQNLLNLAQVHRNAGGALQLEQRERL